MAEVVVDTKALDELEENLPRAKRALIGQLGERGYQLLREEIKDSAYVTGNLWQGVAPADVDYENLTALLVVSARSGRVGAQEGVLVTPHKDGKKTEKAVSLRAQPAYNYADAVAHGRPAISPKHAKALLIPVPFAPEGESYILAGGKVFIMRKSAAATAPNPFDERAAQRLSNEAPNIGKAVLDKFI